MNRDDLTNSDACHGQRQGSLRGALKANGRFVLDPRKAGQRLLRVSQWCHARKDEGHFIPSSNRSSLELER